MAKRKFNLGDKVTVIGSPTVTFAPGVRDEIGTQELLKGMVGKVYTVKGFDKIGNAELWPRRSQIVWIEPEFLKLRARKKKKRKGS